MTTVSILLARGGSKGVPGKNLQPVGGLSLVARSVRAARAASLVDTVLVSTDDAGIAAEARRFGARVVDRPAELSGDAATSESGWLHALEVLQAEGALPERAVFLQCTSPFTTGPDIDATLAAMEGVGADCALSVRPDHGFLWRRDANGFGEGTNHEAGQQRPRRQDLPPSYLETGAVYAVAVQAFRRVGRRFCGKVALHVVDHPPLEIDTPADLAMCNLWARRAEATAPDRARLQAVRALIMDFDGVHTDDRVLVSEAGEEAVRTSRGDGLGLARLGAEGRVARLIVSKERNPVTLRRAEKLGIAALTAIDDKVAAIEGWLAEAGLDWGAVLYIGNDVNDLPALRRAGLSACPSDANDAVLAMADWVVPAPGGRGALRHLADALVEAGH